MFHLKVLVREFFPVYALSTSTISLSEVPSLNHKAGNQSMELGALVTESNTIVVTTTLAGTQLFEILGCPRDDVVIESKDNSFGGSLPYRDVKEDL